MSEASAPKNLLEVSSPDQLLSLLESDSIRAFIHTVTTGEPLPGDPRPNWAIRATSELYQSALRAISQGGSELHTMGVVLGHLKKHGLGAVAKAEPKLAALFASEKAMALVGTALNELPSDQAAQLADGLARGLSEDLLDLGQRGLVYAVLSFGWPVVAQMRNLSEFQDWLTANLPANLVGSRDRLSKICQTVGLRFPDKGGRPPQTLEITPPPTS
jgi:hypothetical protein